MKVKINNQKLTKQEVYRVIGQYLKETHGYRMPAYILIHPKTRYQILTNDHDIYRIIYHTMRPNEVGLCTEEKIIDLWVLQTYEVEPGWFIICG